MINLQVRDPAQGAAQVYAGLYFHDGKPKRSLTAFRFPFVTDRASVIRWAPGARRRGGGSLVIESKHGGGWKRVKRLKVGEGKVFQTKLHLSGKAHLRARWVASTAWRGGNADWGVSASARPNVRRGRPEQPSEGEFS